MRVRAHVCDSHREKLQCPLVREKTAGYLGTTSLPQPPPPPCSCCFSSHTYLKEKATTSQKGNMWIKVIDGVFTHIRHAAVFPCCAALFLFSFSFFLSSPSVTLQQPWFGGLSLNVPLSRPCFASSTVESQCFFLFIVFHWYLHYLL